MLRGTSICILAPSVLLSLGTEAFAFDCAKASLPVDFVICSHPQVFSANALHEAAWYATRARLNDVHKRELLENQRLWLKQYPPTCGVATRGGRPETISPEAQRCVATALFARAEFLKRYGLSIDPPGRAPASSVPSAGWAPPYAQRRIDVHRADVELNRVYQQLMRTLHPQQQKLLREEERAWIKWRDAEADRIARSTSVCCGSAYTADHLSAKLDLIQKRTEVLKHYTPTAALKEGEKTPSAPEVRSKTAQPYEGVWGDDKAECTDQDGVDRMTIKGDRFTWYETRCRVENKSQNRGSWTLRMACEGEGSKWKAAPILSLPSKDTLVMDNSPFGKRHVYVRCPGAPPPQPIPTTTPTPSIADKAGKEPSYVSKIPEGKAPNLIVLVHGCCTDADDVRNIWDSFGREITNAIGKASGSSLTLGARD